MARYLQEPGKNGSEAVISSAAMIDDWSSLHPAIHDHLTEVQWESGRPRVTSTFLVFFEEGLFKICLRDRSSLRTAWVSGKTFTSACEALEVALEAGTVEWRKERSPSRK